MQRRSFLTGMLALGVAPAVVRAASLMRVTPGGILAPEIGLVDNFSLYTSPNRILTISEITNQALNILENELTFVGNVNRSYERVTYGTSRIVVRKPVRFA